MKRLLTLLFAFVITASLSMLAQEPASNPGSTGDKKVDKAEKKEAKPRTAASLECSKEADEKGLKGKERKKFRSQCKKAAADKAK